MLVYLVFNNIVYIVNQYLSIYFSMYYFVDVLSTGGGKESRTPDLLLARQAL